VSDTLPLHLWLGFWRWRQFYHRYSVEGLQHLDGPPALIVGYHGRPLAYDLCMLTAAIYDRLGYLPRTLVHRTVDAIPPLKWLSDGLGFVTRDGDALARTVAAGQHIITAPGGTGEACRSFRDRYRVSWGEHIGYLRVALRYGLRIVPVAAAGVDDGYVGLTDAEAVGRCLGVPRDWVWTLWLGIGPLGPWPISPPFPVRVRQLIGEPIDLHRGERIREDDRPRLLGLHRQVTDTVQALLDRARGESARSD
jgi:1-acyl-sn-glycerol-3-phosphate acyltransferase